MGFSRWNHNVNWLNSSTESDHVEKLDNISQFKNVDYIV